MEFTYKTLQALEDFFTAPPARNASGVYFYRIHGYNEHIERFVQQYDTAARTCGAVIEGKLANPTEKNLAYYDEILGLDFQMSMGFFGAQLQKWLPRLRPAPRNALAASMYDTLDEIRKAGKNDSILRNIYIKFMCWLYYRFESLLHQLGSGQIPKILYEGEISQYALYLLAILAHAGCDVLLLQYNGNQAYLRVDSTARFAKEYCEDGMCAFPETFSLQWLRTQQEQTHKLQRLYGDLPQKKPCTNAWMRGKGFADLLTSAQNRGTEDAFFYNALLRIRGVEDKLTYVNQLFQFQLQLKNEHRPFVIAEKQIPPPSVEEIAGIQRSTYRDAEQMLLGLKANLPHTASAELRQFMTIAFVGTVLEEQQKADMNLNKLTNKAIYLLCWLKRYQSQLFAGWKPSSISCFLHLGGCQNENEVLFLKMLSKLPVDVVILVPDLQENCIFEDAMLYELHFSDSLAVQHFPSEQAEIHMGTAAYHAERELDALLYQDSGMYRNMQYQKAIAVSLQTMYEEIAILWNQELKYRPNFSIVQETVNMPVIFAKISGVKDGNTAPYWAGIQALMTEDTLVVQHAPMVRGTDENPIKAYVTEFLKNGRLRKDAIQAHKAYPYGILRPEMQAYLLEKLQLLIDQRIIAGTFENGTEYTIVATILNLQQDIVRQIQKFDFTKKNPKLIYVHTTDQLLTLEDSIITAFLNLLGFDILFFVPTGYQNIEKFFAKKVFEEHQIGAYVYDLHPPDFHSLSSALRPSWWDKIFKRSQ